ncbi:hypothetical protein [Roseibium sp.]|uniref:hypothetical protein n=1 Tax=Roseibium sp. TaxID=1936156 RepID=UPI003A96B322
MNEEPTLKTTTEARQARRGRPVLAVLLASLAIVVCAFAVIGLFEPDPEPSAVSAENNSSVLSAPTGPVTN